MNRQQRRIKDRQDNKMESKTYTFSECKKMIAQAILETEKKYDVRYSLCLATSLGAPPLNFEKDTVCDVVKLFFDQVEAMRLGIVTEEEVREEAAKLGVMVKNDNDRLEIYIDPTNKENGGE